MPKRLNLAPVAVVALIIIQGCCLEPGNPDSCIGPTYRSSDVLDVGGEIAEISEFMALAERGDLDAVLNDCSNHTLLAPSNKALQTFGAEAVDYLKSPPGFEELSGLLERSVVHEKLAADDLGELLGGAKVLRSEETRDGFVHVIDGLPTVR